MAYTLYFSPGACSFSPHLALREAGLDFTLERVNLGAKTTSSGDDFTAINPKGYVPALRLPTGELLTEGPAIVQWIAEQAPEKNLACKPGTLERARAQEWLTFIGTELHKGFSPLFDRSAGDDVKATAKTRIAKRLDYVNAFLDGKTFLVAEQFTVADGYLFTVLRWAGAYDIQPTNPRHASSSKRLNAAGIRSISGHRGASLELRKLLASFQRAFSQRQHRFPSLRPHVSTPPAASLSRSPAASLRWADPGRRREQVRARHRRVRVRAREGRGAPRPVPAGARVHQRVGVRQHHRQMEDVGAGRQLRHPAERR